LNELGESKLQGLIPDESDKKKPLGYVRRVEPAQPSIP
jgi:hypothetical protein